MNKQTAFVNTIVALITFIGMVSFIRHLLRETDTRLFSEDAVETLRQPRKLRILASEHNI